MKPIPYLLILLSLFLTFSCEDDTDTDNTSTIDTLYIYSDTTIYIDDVDDMM